jgi:hypothetical protein
MPEYEGAIKAQVHEDLAAKKIPDYTLRCTVGAVMAIASGLIAHFFFGTAYSSLKTILPVLITAVLGAFGTPLFYRSILWINYHLKAPKKIWETGQKEICCLKKRIAELEAVPEEPNLSAELQFHNGLAELLIRNSGAATDISARWKEESRTPANHDFLGMPSGYQETTFAGGSAIVHLETNKGARHLSVAERKIKAPLTNTPGARPVVEWTIFPLSGAPQARPIIYPSVTSSTSHLAQYSQLVLLIEIRPHNGNNPKHLALRIKLQGQTCEIVPE